MQKLLLLLGAAALAGCPPVGPTPPGGTPSGPGTLTMRAEWPNNCSTCTKVTYPNHCWTGSWVSGTTSAGGTTSISQCQQRAEILGNPNPISVSTSVPGVKPGKWTVQLSIEGAPAATCPATVPDRGVGQVWVDTAGCHAFPGPTDLAGTPAFAAPGWDAAAAAHPHTTPSARRKPARAARETW